MNLLLIKFLESLKIDIVNSMQANGPITSGHTAQQIIIVEENDKLQLQIPAYIMALENGRRPTGKNAVQGNPPMIERIKQWCQAKGISDKLAWAIKKSIDKKGYPGKPGILTGPLGVDKINARLDPVLNELATVAAEQLMNSLSTVNAK